LGTDLGLIRFDGVRNVSWQPPLNQHLPSSNIISLLVTRDGALWIGTSKGLSSWKGGKLTQYPELSGQTIMTLVEDHEGSVWVGGAAFPSGGTLCAIHNGLVRCEGEAGRFGPGVLALYEDSHGNLWAGVQNGLWLWKPGPAEFHALPGEPDSIRCFDQSRD